MHPAFSFNRPPIPGRYLNLIIACFWASPPLRVFWAFAVLSLAYKIFRPYLLSPGSVQSSAVSLAVLGSIAVAGIGIRRTHLPRLTFYVLATSSVMISVVGLLHVPQYTPGASPNLDHVYWWARVIGVLGAAAGVIAIWRPSFAVIGLGLFYHLDQMTELLYGGLSRTVLDWLTVAEIMLFLGLLIVLHHWAQRALPSLFKGLNGSALTTVTFYCLALHFANYFWSAVAKVVLEGGPLTWLLESPTYNDFTFNIYAGMFPIALLEGSPAQYLYAVLDPLNVTLNGAILLAQGCAILAIMRPRTIQVFSIIYDVFHVGVFILGGILFYKWIALNAAIYFGLKEYAGMRFSRSMAVCMVATILCAPAAFTIARLGWYSTTQGNYIRIEAVDRSGRSYEIPTNYWMARAFEIRSGRFRNAFDGFYPDTAIAGTLSYKFMRASFSCSAEPSGRADPERSHNREALIRLIQQHHRFVVAHADRLGHLNFDAYPHHAWSDFLGPRFAEFRALDKRTIEHYVVSLENVCFDGLTEDGKPNIRIMATSRLIVRP